MDLNSLKLKLVQRILSLDDAELLEKILKIISQETMAFREAQAPYETKKEEPIDLTTLSPEFQEAIKQGLADVDAGRVYTQEQMEKIFEDWLQED